MVPPQPAQGMGVESEVVWAQMARTMANYERAGVAQQIAAIVSELPEFSSVGFGWGEVYPNKTV